MDNVQKVQIVNSKGSGLATAALVLGIIGIVFAFIPLFGMFIAIPCGVLSVIFGLIAVIKKAGGKAIAGLILGILSIIIAIAMSVIVFNAVDDAVNELSDVIDEFNESMIQVQEEFDEAMNQAQEEFDELMDQVQYDIDNFQF